MDRDFSQNEQEIRVQFLDSLPKKLERIAALFSEPELSHVREDSEFWEKCRDEFHKLAGSAATFGFPEVSRGARAIELILAEGERLPESLARLMDMAVHFTEICEAARRDFAREVPLELEVVAEASPRNLAARLEDDSPCLCFYKSEFFFHDESAHLDAFGYRIANIQCIDEAEEFLRQGQCVIFVLDAGSFQEEEESQKRLRRLCTGDYAARCRVMYFCEWDDFDTRIFAVRNCGSAFITAPVDIPRVMDRVHSLFSNTEQEPCHILIVSTDPEELSFYAMCLQRAGMITSVAIEPRHVIGTLIESKPDLILMDPYMAGCSGLELATLIRQQEAFVGIPLVFFSVEEEFERRLEALRHGADDFLQKPVRVEHLISSLTMRVERSRRLRYYMERDSLTGLYNHSQLEKRLVDDLSRSRRIGSRTCYAMIDIDHFKKVNDRYGHLTGDRVLKALTQHLLERLRKTDTVGRYGGEEFGVILFNTDIDACEILMNEIRESFAGIHHKEARHDFCVTFSCGITEALADDPILAIKERADKALYAAKNRGRNKVERA
jgi:diguanylate cyclase (GGDEF)-like protein